MTTTSSTKCLLLFSEDIAEIRSCIWNDFTIRLKGEHNERRDELDKMMETIYNALYCSLEKRIILEDKDRRGYTE